MVRPHTSQRVTGSRVTVTGKRVDSDLLIGIHHAGGNYIRKLNNEKGMYQANEGIRITFIQEVLKNKNP